VADIGHTGSRRYVSQVLCEECRASAYQWTAHGKRGRGVIFHDFGQGPLTGIPKRDPLADLEVAKRITMIDKRYAFSDTLLFIH
jgi:hypothetical protein